MYQKKVPIGTVLQIVIFTYLTFTSRKMEGFDFMYPTATNNRDNRLIIL